MKKFLVILSGVVLVALLYYLFVRPFEFEVNFTAKTLPGDLIATVRHWNGALDSAKVTEIDSLSGLKQTIVWENKSYIYNWHFVVADDSTTKVNIQISEPGKSVMNKILIPFTDQAIEKDAQDIAKRFYDILKEHLEITKVKVIGEVELDSSFCACTLLKTTQTGKAYGMTKDYPLLTSFLEFYKLDADGPPMISVRQWDHNLDSLEFDFCFPIQTLDSLPSFKEIHYKKFGRIHALKAEYNGNYITSDRAWYALMHYAERNGYKATGLPIEYFYDNPNLGSNESSWKAEVFLPVTKK
jgi:hypothetical protein